MPFLRVIRDKRGYETTYLLHWYRDGSRQRSRILYVFRTPGGVRVGRDPMDPEMLRAIEREHPGIEFDWAAMREHRQVIEAAPEPRRRRPKREDALEPSVGAPAGADAATEEVATEAAPAAAAPAIPDAMEGETPAERIAFLRTWHPRIVERIPRRTADPARQEALFALAAQLNPDAWTDADEVSAGLARAAETLERLSRLLTRRRRRSRRHTPAGESAPDGVPLEDTTTDDGGGADAAESAGPESEA